MTRKEWARRPGRSSSFVRKSLRFAIYARDKFDCVYCRQKFPIDLTGEGLHLDHLIPRSKGGTNTPENLVTACARCNTSRQAGRVDDKRARERARRASRRPINRELGRWLSRLATEAKTANADGRGNNEGLGVAGMVFNVSY